MSIWKKFGFAWVTLGFLAFTFIGHWLFGWLAYVDQQQALGQSVESGGYVIDMLRDTFENWQSEFLQLRWQVVGLTILLCVGSPSPRKVRTAMVNFWRRSSERWTPRTAASS
jgi:hypothetical protein